MDRVTWMHLRHAAPEVGQDEQTQEACVAPPTKYVKESEGCGDTHEKHFD